MNKSVEWSDDTKEEEEEFGDHKKKDENIRIFVYLNLWPLHEYKDNCKYELVLQYSDSSKPLHEYFWQYLEKYGYQWLH